MISKQAKRRRNCEELEVALKRRRANQIAIMIAEFDRVCIDLGQQIKIEEMRARIDDPAHFAYPTYAKAARDRRARLQRSADALRHELDCLAFDTNNTSGQQFAA
jgi:flagellar protein FliJ